MVNNFLKEALDFYESKGVKLDYDPKILSLREKTHEFPGTRALVQSESLLSNQFADLCTQYLSKHMWKEAHNLEVSEEAIRQCNGLLKRFLRGEEQKEPGYQADIILFKPYFQSPAKIQRDIIAHEIWHLIEERKDLIRKHPFICEGTATYAMKRFAGGICDKEIEDCKNILDVFYEGAGTLVQLGLFGKPFSTMLDPEWRTDIQHHFLNRIKPVIVRQVNILMQNPNYKKMMAEQLRQLPEMAALEGNLSAEGLIKAYKKLGADKLAEEIEGKNLDKLIEWFKLVGF